MRKSKFAEQLSKLSDKEVRLVTTVLLNPKTYELMRIVMTTPYHSRPVQVGALQERLEKLKLKVDLKMLGMSKNQREQTWGNYD